ncbi:MAG: hypothetical protein LKJ05_06475 [Bifidobacteriaceae bacterium]|nr:hypothetical protein [Bifidobacteriaceae bacterium]
MVDYDLAAQAVQDENADPAFLARIAYENPEFGPNVAAHPRAYPGLLAWISQFGTDQARRIVEQRADDLPLNARMSMPRASHTDAAPNSTPARDESARPVESAQTEAPAETPENQQQPTHGFTAAQALDPATDPMTQHNIAEYAPELRVYLAQNPNIYPELLTWLGSLNDPQINAAIAQRR